MGIYGENRIYIHLYLSNNIAFSADYRKLFKGLSFVKHAVDFEVVENILNEILHVIIVTILFHGAPFRIRTGTA